MDVSVPANELASYPDDELRAAIAHEARKDADQVAASLNEIFSALDRLYPALALGDRWRDILPSAFYLRLAAALRILELERRGTVIPAMQLPAGGEVFAGALQSAFDYSDEIPPHVRQVLFVFRRFFGWQAAVEMGASIVIDDIDEAELADQIAIFLWDHRHTLGENEIPKQNSRGNHAIFYHRDSLGRSDQTPAKYVEWAQSESRRRGLDFDGSADAINSLILSRRPECGDVYLDYNVAGNLLERPALSALRRRIENDKRVGHVFIPMAARLARPHDSEDGVRLEKQIRRMGVTIHYRDTTLAPLEANERADIGEQITSLISFDEAGKFRGDLADKMIEAQRNLSQQGLSTGGRPPFFLRRWLIDPQGRPERELADGESVRKAGHHVAWLPTDPEKLALALRIVEMLEKMPATQVAKCLTLEGIPSPDAGRTRRDRGQSHFVSGAWHATTIVNVVRSLFLVGKAVYGRRSMGDQRRYSPEGPRDLTDMDYRLDGEPKVIRNPESEWTVVAARFDALVEPERLERLLTELDKRGASQRGKPRSRDPANNPLGCRVYDMACGWPMYRERFKKTKQQYSFRYKCGQYTQSHGAACTCNSIDGPLAVRLTLGAICQRLASPTLRARIAENLEALANRAQADNPVQLNVDTTTSAIASIHKELEIVARNLSRAETDVQFQVISAEFERLKKQESRLEIELHKLKGESHALQNPAKEVAAAIDLLDRLDQLATKVESFTAAHDLIGLVDAKLFLKFEEQAWGKRKVFKPIGGFLTFGATLPPIKIYEGHTGRVALQNALKSSGSPPCQCGEEDEPTIEKADSIGNVSRGDRI